MKILLTGASGFLGSNFLREIVRDDAIDKIYCLCRSDLPFSDNKIVHIKRDINEMRDLNLDDSVDVVLHFAAYLKYESAKMFDAVNVKGTESVITFCKNNGVKRIIHCSTINVKLKRKGGYAKTKLKAEEVVKNSGLNYIIARPTLIYGANDNGLNKMITSAKKLGCIPVFDSGKFLQQPIFVNELVAFFRELIFCKLENTVLELGGLERLTYVQMIDSIGNILGKKVRAIKIPAALVLAALSVIEFFGIPFPLRRETIHQINEDLVCENDVNLSVFNVRQCGFEENLRGYL